ncbi:unnamed protein product [Lymnaea stagnalis]|uniref:Uncharacterized protein n=1 Tax=Lymnaea stagnalis TaxID=6523 RepID=A0AAV2H3N4_LYMST
MSSAVSQKEEQHQKVKQRFRNVLTKVTHVRRAISPVETITKIDNDRKRQESLASVESCESDLPPYSSDKESNKVKAPSKEKTTVNKYKLIGKHIDLVSFVCFFLVWLGVTVGFMLNIAVF